MSLPGFIPVNRRVVIRDDEEAELRGVLVGGVPLLLYGHDDVLSQRAACVILVVSGHAKQLEVCAAFGVPRRTLHRWVKAYKARGLEALAPYHPTGRKSVVPASVVRAIVKLHSKGLGVRRISQRLGLPQGIVRGVYKRENLEPVNEMVQDVLRGLGDGQEAAPEPAPQDEVCEEQGESFCEGLWTPAPAEGRGIPRAGVLLALPVLAKLKTINAFRKAYAGVFGAIPRYGLEVMVLVMVFLALWRIRRPENLKEVSPQELGRVLGLERVPEMKTVRGKLARMASRGGAQEVMRQVAEVRISEDAEVLGVLYVDGHVRPYSGRFKLAKGYATQRRQCVPATTDTWAHDRDGAPVLVVTSEINQHLSEVLEDVLADARKLVGERRITVVFDRGGWSPKLFVRLIEAGYDLITYRKGTVSDLGESAFSDHIVNIDEKNVKLLRLHDEPEATITKSKLIWKDGKRPLVLREITKLAESGKQTRVVTTRSNLGPVEVLETLFARWRQENFFKYMGEAFDMDGLVEYGAVPVDEAHSRPNPEVTRLTKKIKALRRKIADLQGQRCELLGERPATVEKIGGFEKFVPSQHKQVKLLEEIRGLKASLEELEARRQELPERISAGGLERLKDGRKQVANLFKLLAYHIETELVRLVSPHYARSEDEARKLIAAAFSSAADYEIHRDTLTVTLAPQASPHRSRAIVALCRELNALPSPFPGTQLRVTFACREEPR